MMTTAPLIEIREATEDIVGCISARATQFGPEICYAVGREHGTWYLYSKAEYYRYQHISFS